VRPVVYIFLLPYSISSTVATQTVIDCRDLDIELGSSLYLVLMDGEGQSSHLTSSITALERPDCTRYLRKCFQRVLKEEELWSGPLSLNILDVQLVLGETIDPTKATRKIEVNIEIISSWRTAYLP
jgi:hypothetical protein